MKPSIQAAVHLALWTTWIGSTNIQAAQLANRKETLQGHRSVFVAVTTPVSVEVTRDLGLIKESLEQYVVAHLKKSGIPASTEFIDQTLVLEITVDVHKVIQADDLAVFAFISQFEALQAAKLATNRQSALATTWKATQFGAVTRSQAQRLKDSVTINLEQFVADWQQAQAAQPTNK